MKVEEIIQKAIEGGRETWSDEVPGRREKHSDIAFGPYKIAVEVPRHDTPSHHGDEGECISCPVPYWKTVKHSDMFLDPFFWVSLGKGMGWKNEDTTSSRDPDGGGRFVAHFKPWLYQWHRFIDHLADGKTPEEFFGGLN